MLTKERNLLPLTTTVEELVENTPTLSQPPKPPQTSGPPLPADSQDIDEWEENLVHAKYISTTDSAEKAALEEKLIALLKKHCLAVCSQRLQESRMDLTNQALADIIRYLPTFEGRNGAKFSTWVHHIIKTICSREITKKIKDRTYWLQFDGVVPKDGEGELYVPASPEEKKVHARILVDKIREGLSKEELIIFDMFLERKTAGEIAVVAGGDENTVRCRWFRLKEKLQKRFPDISF
jgi:RNA polymerase sigma factor (sigma-70 family)